MTLLICLKVGEGVVMAADSATTYTSQTGGYHNSYYNAEKLFNVAKGLPVGAMTTGLSALGHRSIVSHFKEFRSLVSDPAQARWHIDPTAYSVGQVAERLRDYFYEELYRRHIPPPPGPQPTLRFMLGGYSTGKEFSEIWGVKIENGASPPPSLYSADSEPVSIIWDGASEACQRLIRGFSTETKQRLMAAGMSEPEAVAVLASDVHLIHPTMPIQDAIDLADYLVEATCGFARFAPGPNIVARPVDTAAITRFEGWRWVHRKHYYSRELNLPHPPPS